jgi:hypothetical protein
MVWINGRDIPTTRKISLNIPDEYFFALKRDTVNISGLLNALLDDYFDRVASPVIEEDV